MLHGLAAVGTSKLDPKSSATWAGRERPHPLPALGCGGNSDLAFDDLGKSAECRNSRSNVATPRGTDFSQDRGFRYGYLCIMKLPSWQFYPGDWRKDPGVQALNYEERGIWFEVLLLMYESEERGKLLLNGNPMPMDRLARLLGLDEDKINRTINTLLELGVASTYPKTGIIHNRRMVRDEEFRRKKSKAGHIGGGNPMFQKGKSNPYYDKQKDKQIDKQKIGSSSSSSSSISFKKKSKIGYPLDFTVSETMINLAREKGWPDPNSEIEAFKDHHVAKDSRFLDWGAAFRTWLRNAKKFSRGNDRNVQLEGELSERTKRILRRGL